MFNDRCAFSIFALLLLRSFANKVKAAATFLSSPMVKDFAASSSSSSETGFFGFSTSIFMFPSESVFLAFTIDSCLITSFVFSLAYFSSLSASRCASFSLYLPLPFAWAQTSL